MGRFRGKKKAVGGPRAWSYSFDSVDRLLRAGLQELSSNRARSMENLTLACHIYDALPVGLFDDIPGTKTDHLVDLLAMHLDRLFARDPLRPLIGKEIRRLAGYEIVHVHIREFGYFSFIIHLFYWLYRRSTSLFFLELAFELCESYRSKLHPIAKRIRFWSAMHRSFELALFDYVITGQAERSLALVEKITARGFLEVYLAMMTPGPTGEGVVERYDVVPSRYDVVPSIGTQVSDDNVLYPITEAYEQPLEDFPLYSRRQLFLFVDECPVFHQDRRELPQAQTLSVADIARSLPEAWAYVTYRQVDDQLMCSVLAADGTLTLFRVNTSAEEREGIPLLELEFASVLDLLRRLGAAGLPVHQRDLTLPDSFAASETLVPLLRELHDLVFWQPTRDPHTGRELLFDQPGLGRRNPLKALTDVTRPRRRGPRPGDGGARNPLEALVGVTQLLIMPGFPLQDVPIAAAHDGHSFLIERCGVAFVPSGTWFGLRQTRSESRALETALVLADPTSDLPGARREGELIVGLLRRAGVEVTLRGGGEATRRWLLEAGRRFDLVHYAGHGSFELSSSSFLSLADGPLLLADLLTGPWRPRLVVLNACRSGVRAVHLLDETLSMASGFLAAGVGAVVSTLWPVGDAIALRFADSLYTALLQHRPIGAAYQASLINLIRSQVSANAWAPYFLAGDPRVQV